MGLLVLLMSSCHHTAIRMMSKSPDGKTMLSVDGERSNSLDPFKVNMRVKSGDIPEGSLSFELEASEMNDSTVKFDWKDAGDCIVSFAQRDGEPRYFTLHVSSTNVLMQELPKN